MKLLLLGVLIMLSSIGVTMSAATESTGQPSQTIIILLGPPGSGKGTQAVRIAKQLNIPHISTGDLFRDNIKNHTDLGKLAKTYMDAGNLVPDSVVLDMLFDRVARPDCAKGYLLDGFPRTIPQAEAFDAQIPGNAQVVALNLDVPDEEIVKRVAGRLTCQSCGNIHNLHFSPPAKPGKCDKCQGELVQRPDDAPEIVEERLKVYHTQTEPLIDFYKKKEVLVTVNGSQDPNQVFADLIKHINEKFSQSLK
jgi:adenylate kinase